MAKINEGLAKQPNNIEEVPVGVYAYDLAIIEDLRTRFSYDKNGKKKTNQIVQITNAENVFNIIGDIENDNIQFPIISLVRTGWEIIDYSQEFMNNSGGLVGYLEDDKGQRTRQVRLQALPIQINYQLDIWTQNRIDNDILAREIIWFYTLNPQMRVKIPHGLNITHPFNIAFEKEIVDNSDIQEHNSRGRYYRQTLGIYTDNDAYLWKSSVTNVPSIELQDLLIYEGDIRNKDDLMFKEETNFTIPEGSYIETGIERNKEGRKK